MFSSLYEMHAALFIRKKSFDNFDYVDGGIFPVFVYSSNRKYAEIKTFAPATIDTFISAVRKLSDDYVAATNEESFKSKLKDYFRWFKFPSDELQHCLDIFHCKKYDILYKYTKEISKEI